jgi:hypothetical protein
MHCHSHFFQVGLLHFVLSSMGITEISDEEIASLIGSDPGIAHGRSGQDKLDAQQQINDENEGVVAEFRSLQVRCSYVSCDISTLRAKVLQFRRAPLMELPNFATVEINETV